MKFEKPENLLVCGDIHGNWGTLLEEVIRHKIKNAIIIIAGDCGIGSEKIEFWETLEKKIARKTPGVQYVCIRGNHDNPEQFDSATIFFDHLKAVSDYEILEIGSKRILPIGGAQSIDQDWRIKVNSKYEHFGSHKRIWWEDERPEKDKNLLKHIGKIDIIVSHEGPISLGPVISRTGDMTAEIYDNILEDRKYLQEILIDIHPDYWYFGHYHQSLSGTNGKTLWRTLGINELTEIFYEE